MNISQPGEYSAKIQMIGQFWKQDELNLFKKQIKELCDTGIKQIIVDLFRLSFISSQGLGLLVTTFSELKKNFANIEFIPSTKGWFIERLRAKLVDLSAYKSNEIVAGNISDILVKFKKH